MARLHVYLGSRLTREAVGRSVGRPPDIHMTRQNILITGASSGLGGGMARQFAAQGRYLALSARRTDRLAELKVPLLRVVPLSVLKRFA